MFRRFLSCRGFAIGLIATLGATVCCGSNSPTGPSATPVSAFAVSTISPNTGGLGGATSVTIFGTGFQVGATVSFDGAVANATVSSSTAIVARTPVHSAGKVDVVVVNPDGRAAGCLERSRISLNRRAHRCPSGQ